MINTIRLEKTAPISHQIAAFLLKDRTQQPVDLGDTLVLIPTAGAARSIRGELARHGVLSPDFNMPMDALLPPGIATANQMEREAAWSLALDPAQRQQFNTLIPEIVPLESPADRLGVAARLCKVCDELAEAGLDPQSNALPDLIESDALRWNTFGTKYRDYLAVLKNHQLRDPNDLRLEQSITPSIPGHIKQVVLACIPDLPMVVRRFLEALARSRIQIHVLVWSPAGQATHVDEWGSPSGQSGRDSSLITWWKKNTPLIPAECLVTANDPATEAGLLMDEAGKRTSAGYALFSAAPESIVALAQEITWREAEPYLPEGRPLALSEWSEILQGWDTFIRSKRLRDLRVLLQKPAFLSFFISKAGKPAIFTATAAIEACDRLISEQLCTDLDAARSWLTQAEHHKPTDKRGLSQFLGKQDLVVIAFALAREITNGALMLSAVSKHGDAIRSGSSGADEITAISEAITLVSTSSLLASLPPDLRNESLNAEIKRKNIFAAATADVIEIQGWLEAPWSNAPAILIAGCREGALPAGTYDDPFLPDSAKARLGLMTQDARLARDTYLLSCLMSAHPSHSIRLGFARSRNQGEPNRPSRLLFGCADEELAERTSRLFKPDPPASRAGRTEKKFSLIIPRAGGDKPRQIDSIRVTGFRSYLACPFRFYLSNILRLQTIDPDAREIPANTYGTIMHSVLEDFCKDTSLRHVTDAGKIARALSDRLDAVIPRFFGEHPTPVVRVQIESMRSRLEVAAETEATIRQEGWSTIATEYKVDQARQLLIEGLAVTGTMDRVDYHPEKGLRILDYKTFGKAKTPAATHLGPHRIRQHMGNAGDLAQYTQKGKVRLRSWIELQLPLYHWLAGQIWTEESRKGVGVGYFLLHAESEPEKDALALFDLDEKTMASAMKAARHVAAQVKRGCFWPPSPANQVQYDEFAQWFGTSRPENIIDAQSIRWLKGNP